MSGFFVSVEFGASVRANGEQLRCVGDISIGCAGHVVADGRPAVGTECAEVLISAYRKYGGNLSAHVLGQYGAAIIDHSRRRAVLVQDSLGLRSLYHSRETDGTLLVASNLPLFLSLHPNVTLDTAFFECFLMFGARSPGRTPFAGVRRLAMGETLIVDAVQSVVQRPWQPSPHAGNEQPVRQEEKLVQLLNEAVRSTLPMTGRVLIELSGGLDSSSVACSSFSMRPDIDALTFVSGRGRAGPDQHYAAIVAEHLNIRHWHQFDQDPYPPFSMIPAIPEAIPGGEIRAGLRAAYYGKLRGLGIDVVITGSGGDQIFGSVDVPPIHIADCLRKLDFTGAWRQSATWKDRSSRLRSESFLLWHYGILGLWRYLRKSSLTEYPALRAPSWMSDDVAFRWRGLQRLQIPYRVKSPSGQLFWEMLVRLADNESMAPDLKGPSEIRHPLFYRPLAEFMASLGSAARRPGPTRDRELQRKALRCILPEAVRTRTDKGSNQPTREASFLSNTEWLKMLSDQPLIARFGWVKLPEWRQAIKKARFGVVANPMSFDAAMCVERWLQLNGQWTANSAFPIK